MQITKDGSTFETTTTIKDSTGKPVKVPGGFKIASDSANNVEDGVVIEDSSGNQFVWIPVTKESDYVRNRTYQPTNISSVVMDDSSSYLPNGISNEKQAVLNAGGFYIGRFETKKGLVCKKGVAVWNYITKTNAVSTAKSFVNNSYVKSALISGIQWDVTLAFVNR